MGRAQPPLGADGVAVGARRALPHPWRSVDPALVVAVAGVEFELRGDQSRARIEVAD